MTRKYYPFLLAQAAAVMAVPTGASAQEHIYQLNIPSQSLDSALRSFARTTRQQVLFDRAAVKGRKSPALVGMYTVDRAVHSLLAKSDLEAIQGASGVYVIRRKSEISRDPASAPKKYAAAQVSLDPQAAASAREEVVPQDIVVTARRKDELLANVPASITAYSSDFLAKQNIQTFADYATKIPNVTFQYGQGSDFSATGFSGGRVTTIRGVAGANTTAYYLNDTPIPSSVSPQTLGLDRIEVLKGPQGTLFGASSMGGNLRFITRKPSLTNNSFTTEMQIGKTRSGGADYGVEALGGVVLIPDTMALDISFGYTRESGFLKRRFPDPSAAGAFITKDDQGRSDAFTGSLTLRTRL
ncbi:MAG: TonB-dependent receptor plug domain-containing protein, partial [Novosphingobium sp.]